jgi:hypothetical protein
MKPSKSFGCSTNEEIAEALINVMSGNPEDLQEFNYD